MNTVEINKLTKDYGNNKGIFDLSFHLEAGEVVGFLGPNGAGKTTTIRHLLGFLSPDTGTSQILGRDCFKDAPEVQKHVAYLPGEIAFMDNMNGQEFISFIASMNNIKNTDRINELIHYFELNPNQKIKRMSKGMKQKIGLVIAFMQDAPILILDEPTSGLDPLMQNKFVDLINSEKEKGKTILMSSHMFEEIEHTCERIVMIKEGRIIADEQMTNIRNAQSKYYEIEFTTQSDAMAFRDEIKDSVISNQTTVSFLLKDHVSDLIKTLAKYEVTDINARYQSLEEVFLKYYGGEQ